MNNYYNESKIVQKGQIGEKVALNYILNVKQEILLEDGINNDYKYDYITNLNKYEVKTDYNYNTYNSVYLEFESKLKPSGIFSTHANIYIFVCPIFSKNKYILFEIKVKILKKLIKTNNFNIKKSSCKSYQDLETNLYNLGYIISKEILMENCITYFKYNILEKIFTILNK
jgi:hypothetical protein